jgi:hypothetical protein
MSLFPPDRDVIGKLYEYNDGFPVIESDLKLELIQVGMKAKQTDNAIVKAMHTGKVSKWHDYVYVTKVIKSYIDALTCINNSGNSNSNVSLEEYISELGFLIGSDNLNEIMPRIRNLVDADILEINTHLQVRVNPEFLHYLLNRE